MCNRKVKGYIIAYRLKGTRTNKVKTLFIAHYSDKEAKALFLDYAEAQGFKNSLAFTTCVKLTRKLDSNVYNSDFVKNEIEQIKKGK